MVNKVVYNRIQEFVVEGALLRSEGAKFEAQGRERGIGSWKGTASPLLTSYRVWRSTVSSPQWSPQPRQQNKSAKCILGAIRAQQTLLVATMSFSSRFSVRFDCFCVLPISDIVGVRAIVVYVYK